MFLPPPAATMSDAPHPKAEVRTSASIRIERPATASREQWEKTPKSLRRETIIVDEQGRPLLVRIIDHE